MPQIEAITITASDAPSPRRQSCHCTVVWLIAIGAMLYSCVPARSQQPWPQQKPGSTCPSNYYVSNGYCKPNEQAGEAIPKIGANCPSGYYVSGQFCVKPRR